MNARAILVAAIVGLAPVATLQAQVLTTEVDLTGGYSSDERLTAAAAQLRVFGETTSQIRFNVEGTWAARSEDGTDAFGAAYPYGGRLQLSEAYAERVFNRGRGLVGVRVGQYRTPFGIYTRSDYAYQGFLRAPLIRYDDYWSISNNFLERGVNVVAGTSRLSVEASAGVPGDIGTVRRRTGLNRVVRAQGYYKAVIVGVSHINSEPYAPARYASGRLNFTGADVRWAHGGVQVRGEWIKGRPWSQPATSGWYVDTIVHRRFMGPVTTVFRSEQLDYSSTRSFVYHGSTYTTWTGRRQTAGARIRLPAGFTAQVGVMRQSDALASYGHTALDVGLTYSIRRD